MSFPPASKTVLLASLLLCTSGLPAQISWEADFERALERSKAEKKLLFIAINMEGERANDEVLKVHYKDGKIAKLSKSCVNLFASANPAGKRGSRISGVSHDQAAQIEMRVREKYLGIGPDQDVVAPQHLLISPEGRVLLSVCYRITVGELEWMFVSALQKLDPQFEYKVSDRMRAPKRLKMGYEAPKATPPKIPTQQEIDTIIKDLRKGRGAFKGNMDRLSTILRSEDKAAIQFVGSTLKSRWVRGGRRASILEEIGKRSPKPWYVILKDYISSRDDDVRDAAIISSGRLAESKLASSLKKQLSKEEDTKIQGHLMRSLVACSPKDRAAIKAIQKALAGSDADLRMQAIVAASMLEDRKAVIRFMTQALHDASSEVRSTVAWSIGTRREKDLRGALEMRLESESDEDTKMWMEAARTCLEGGDGKAFENFLVEVVGDKREKRSRDKKKKDKGK